MEKDKEIRARVSTELKDRVSRLTAKRPDYTESDVVRFALEAVCDHFEQFGDIVFPIEVRPGRSPIEKLRADLERQARYLESIRQAELAPAGRC
jgi:predicted DNA-binding protein